VYMVQNTQTITKLLAGVIMNTIKTNHLKAWMAAILVGITFTACDTVNTTDDALTEQDIQAIQAVIGDALSDQSEGLMSELYDITGGISPTGIEEVQHHVTGEGTRTQHRPRRGQDMDYHGNYDGDTGWHTIAFRRLYEGPLFQKYMAALLQYRFSTEEGRWIEWPQRQAGNIFTIEFQGEREGYARGVFRNSDYLRKGSWVLDGYNTGVMELAGRQNNTGSMSVTLRDGGMIEREFDLGFEVVDVTISKPGEQEERLEYLVTGNIHYQITLKHTRNGETRLVENRGTIELNGDGSALMRLMGLPRVVRIDLATGEVDPEQTR
jgi:hypothetical protein